MADKPSIRQLIQKIIALRSRGTYLTLLAVCPNSDAVLEAAVKATAQGRMPMLFAATLNQVDRDGGYTGWTPKTFVARMSEFARKYGCIAPLYPCLDHGGPWLKDMHTLNGLRLSKTMSEVKLSLAACLEAGYALLHIDPTVDRELPKGQPPSIDVVVDRTLELIEFAEGHRQRLGLQEVAYEVGTEEVHGGLVNEENFTRFLAGLRIGLQARGLAQAWPSFIVAKVGTDLHTTDFDAQTAQRLFKQVSGLGSLIKGHYTDWVANPQDYPLTGMGGANVGPEFTASELSALYDLCQTEASLAARPENFAPSHFQEALRGAVVDSGRWQKWLLPEEAGMSFSDLTPQRQEWLVSTGARYIWTAPRVLDARRRLYENLQGEIADPHGYVVGKITENINRYIAAFGLQDSLELLLD
jgi:tagatose-1,6-bisphosphate aldolase non-catalytic subunit AgaZ/GatZ